MSWVAVAIVSAATITAGVSINQGNQQQKAIKNAANDADQRNQKALADAKAAQDMASSQAQQQIRDRRLAIGGNRTIMTSPLGLTEQANTAKKTLLGA
jgi:hypothetical protein